MFMQNRWKGYQYAVVLLLYVDVKLQLQLQMRCIHGIIATTNLLFIVYCYIRLLLDSRLNRSYFLPRTLCTWYSSTWYSNF